MKKTIFPEWKRTYRIPDTNERFQYQKISDKEFVIVDLVKQVYYVFHLRLPIRDVTKLNSLPVFIKTVSIKDNAIIKENTDNVEQEKKIEEADVGSDDSEEKQRNCGSDCV